MTTKNTFRLRLMFTDDRGRKVDRVVGMFATVRQAIQDYDRRHLTGGPLALGEVVKYNSGNGSYEPVLSL